MKTERPILFSGAMVRAILQGRKTQTRRVIKTHPLTCPPYFFSGEVSYDLGFPASRDHVWARFCCDPVWPEKGSAFYFKCPYGKPGDRLWVRETTCIAPKRWATPDDTCRTDYEGDKRYVSYKADGQSEDAMRDYKLNWTPSIHVPRWASRIDLEITGVRVERLQDISEADAIAEGIEWVPDNYGNGPAYRDYRVVGREAFDTAEWFSSPINSYQSLWDSINGKQKPNKPDVSWAANPWVWVVEFKRVEGRVA